MEGFIVGMILGTWFGWGICCLITVSVLTEGGD